MNKKHLLWLPLLLLAGGCFWGSSYREVADYDLTPVKTKLPVAVKFDIFRNLSGADRRFLYSRGNEVFCDEYNRWISGPEVMLMRALSAAMPDSTVSGVRLGITVYRFVWSGTEARLGVEITLSQNGTTKVWNKLFTSNAKDKTPAELAAAMSDCVELLAGDIASALAADQKKK